MIVANCTTPANYFHLLRRQQLRDFRKPLVVMTPKSLLRHPKVVSSVNDFSTDDFQEVIDDTSVKANDVKRVLLCSGKIYYDLLDKQQSEKIENVAIVRLEQLYPVPEQQLKELKKKYKKASFVWVQEENENMGAWPFYCRTFNKSFLDLDVVARDENASPATGFMKLHIEQQKELLERAFKL